MIYDLGFEPRLRHIIMDQRAWQRVAGCVDVGNQSVEDVDSAIYVAGGVDRMAV